MKVMMIIPEKEAVLSMFNAEYECGNIKEANTLRQNNIDIITPQDILDWEQLHERTLRGW